MLQVLCAAALLLTPPRAAAGAALPAKPRLTHAEAHAMLKEISTAVEQIRGLKFKTPVDMKIISGADVRRNFKAKIEPRDEELAVHAQHAYVHMGLIPRGTSLLTSFLDTAETGVAGYYEPGTKIFYLVDHVDADQVRGVMAHELTHALEDQHYDLKAISKTAEGDDDRSTAISAVIEGSASVVAMAFHAREYHKNKWVKKEAEARADKDRADRAERLKNAPSFTQRSLMMPYILGITFLLRGNVFNWFGPGGGVRVEDLDQAYANPPRSTRHILHPDQYWRNATRKVEPLTMRDLSPILGPGWSKALSGSIGELGLSVLTGATLDLTSAMSLFPNRWTHDPSVGTIGDLFHHYVNGDRRATVLLTRWETTRDAEEFERALLGKRRFVRFGVNFLLLAGEIGDKDEALALAAFEQAAYWPAE